MIRVAFSVSGAESASASLERLQVRINGSAREPLAQIGERWAEVFRRNVTSGRPGWAPRSEVSERLRPGRLMNVAGGVLNSIRHNLTSDSSVTAGSDATPKLLALALGSRQSDRSAFPGAGVPARPWAVLDPEDIDDAISRLSDYYLGDA